jgi:signal transduction histidine kinase
MPPTSVLRTVRTRLFLWFLGAIVLAVAAGVAIVGYARPEAATGGEVVARTVGQRLAEVWDDHRATDAYLEQVREVTGFELQLHRGPRGLPPAVRTAPLRKQVLVSAGPEQVWVPVVRGDQVVGALRMERFGFRPAVTHWWRVALGIVAALAILAAAAGRVSNLLARPLEELGHAADRFGGGDLSFRTELAGARSYAEVTEVARAFNQMAERVESTVRSQRELLGAVSHELRSPLGRARIALEIARDRLVGEDSSQTPPPSGMRSPAPQLDEIERQLGEVDAILSDLLAVTRAGLADLRKEALTVLPWLRERVARAARDGAVIEILADGVEDLRVSADGALLGRALHNLVANACSHGHPKDVPIVVRVEKLEGGRVAIVVRDRGPGFAPALLPRAFEPFVRGDASRARSSPSSGGGTAGAGLGLALVRRIAEAHGGEAFARNVVEGDRVAGAEVGLKLPCILAEVGEGG